MVTLLKFYFIYFFCFQVQSYKDLSAAQGGGAVDAGPDYEQKKTEAIARLANIYNIKTPTEFPSFEFKEPNLAQDDIELK